MNRLEIYLQLKELQLVEKCNNHFKKNYTNVKSNELIAFIEQETQPTTLQQDKDFLEFLKQGEQNNKVNKLVGRRFCDVETLKDEIKKMFNTEDIDVVFVESDDIMIDDTIIITIDNIGLDITLYYILTKANYLYITETDIELYIV